MCLLKHETSSCSLLDRAFYVRVVQMKLPKTLHSTRSSLANNYATVLLHLFELIISFIRYIYHIIRQFIRHLYHIIRYIISYHSLYHIII